MSRTDACPVSTLTSALSSNSSGTGWFQSDPLMTRRMFRVCCPGVSLTTSTFKVFGSIRGSNRTMAMRMRSCNAAKSVAARERPERAGMPKLRTDSRAAAARCHIS
jgi:hypothetical protein